MCRKQVVGKQRASGLGLRPDRGSRPWPRPCKWAPRGFPPPPRMPRLPPSRRSQERTRGPSASVRGSAGLTVGRRAGLSSPSSGSRVILPRKVAQRKPGRAGGHPDRMAPASAPHPGDAPAPEPDRTLPQDIQPQGSGPGGSRARVSATASTAWPGPLVWDRSRRGPAAL